MKMANNYLGSNQTIHEPDCQLPCFLTCCGPQLHDHMYLTIVLPHGSSDVKFQFAD